MSNNYRFDTEKYSPQKKRSELKSDYQKYSFSEQSYPVNAPGKKPKKKKKEIAGTFFGILFVVLVSIGIFYFFMRIAPRSPSSPSIFPVSRSAQKEENVGEDILNQSRSSFFYYKQLSESEKRLYRLAYACIMKNEYTIGYNTAAHKKDDLNRVADALCYDNPEFFWLKNCWQCTEHSDGTAELELYCYDFWPETFNHEEQMAQLEEKLDEIVKKASVYESDYEKAKFVHDYLVKNIDYAVDELEETHQTDYSSDCMYIYTAYGALVNRTCVCAGYSKAYQLIMNRLGVYCAYISGNVKRGAHAWNYIGINGKGYFCDVTWDDYGAYGDERIYHKYFCITKSKISQDHFYSDDSDFDLP